MRQRHTRGTETVPCSEKCGNDGEVVGKRVDSRRSMHRDRRFMNLTSELLRELLRHARQSPKTLEHCGVTSSGDAIAIADTPIAWCGNNRRFAWHS